MKRLLLLGFLTSLAASTSASAGQQTIVFLHNAWFEKNKNGEAHAKFGTYDFAGIRAAFAKDAKVIAPERGPGAKPDAAAEELVALIESLKADGVTASDIKIIGASKGAFIAQLASEKIAEPDIRWVLVGGCHVKRMAKDPAPRMTGRVLSLYDTSDNVAGPCAGYPELTQQAALFEERAVETGKGHGFQFTADPAWTEPARAW